MENHSKNINVHFIFNKTATADSTPCVLLQNYPGSVEVAAGRNRACRQSEAAGSRDVYAKYIRTRETYQSVKDPRCQKGVFFRQTATILCFIKCKFDQSLHLSNRRYVTEVLISNWLIIIISCVHHKILYSGQSTNTFDDSKANFL